MCYVSSSVHEYRDILMKMSGEQPEITIVDSDAKTPIVYGDILNPWINREKVWLALLNSISRRQHLLSGV